MFKFTTGEVRDLALLPADIAAWITVSASGCWEWQRARNNFGYGHMFREGRHVYVHRVVFEILASPIPHGYVLDHLCRNPPCCNPAHLEPVTHAENGRRAREAARLGLPVQAVRRLVMAMQPPPGRWLAIPGFPEYMVSDRGRVWSRPRTTTRGGLLKLNTDSHGRVYVNLTRNGKQKVRRVHQLVAEAFIGPCPSGMEVRHLDGNPANNSLANLQYSTHAVNMADMVAHGTSKSHMIHCKRGHEFTPENTRVGKSGSRFCRACQRDRYRRSHPLIVDNLVDQGDRQGAIAA